MTIISKKTALVASALGVGITYAYKQLSQQLNTLKVFNDSDNTSYQQEINQNINEINAAITKVNTKVSQVQNQLDATQTIINSLNTQLNDKKKH